MRKGYRAIASGDSQLRIQVTVSRGATSTIGRGPYVAKPRKERLQELERDFANAFPGNVKVADDVLPRGAARHKSSE